MRLNFFHLTPILITLIISCSYANAEWKVGLPICLTTACSAQGDQSAKGAELAAQELNEKGGVLGQKVKLVIEDTAEATSAATSVSAYRKLRTDPDIQYFIGPTWTAAGLALSPIAAKENVVMTSPTLGIREFAAQGANIFNVYGTDESASRFLAQFAVKKGWKVGAIFSSQQPWDSAQAGFFEDEFKKLGGRIASKQEPVPDNTDVRTESIRIIASKPDVIFLSNVSNQLPLALMALRNFKFSVNRLVVWIDETIINDSKGAAEGCIAARMLEPKPWFVERFKAHYGSLPEFGSYSAYDTLMIYARAIEEAKSFEPKLVIPILAKTKYDGASGQLNLDADGNAVRTPTLKIVKDGKLVLYQD